MSTAKSPGQVAFTAFYGKGLFWDNIEDVDRKDWEAIAKAVLSNAKITAEDVKASIYSAFGTGFGYQSGWGKMAEFLNARFQPQDEAGTGDNANVLNERLTKERDIALESMRRVTKERDAAETGRNNICFALGCDAANETFHPADLAKSTVEELSSLRQAGTGRVTKEMLSEIRRDIGPSGCYDQMAKHINSRLTSPWVPCAERMPTVKDGDERGLVLVIFPTGFVQCLTWKEASTTGRGIAWMPIPPLPLPNTPSPEEDAFEKWWKSKEHLLVTEGTELEQMKSDCRTAFRAGQAEEGKV